MKTVYLKLTNGCNLKCKHCYNEQMYNHSKMSDDIICKAIAYINGLALKEKIQVQLHGGEPFLLKAEKIKDICNRLNSNIEINATTNLMYKLSPQILDIFKQFTPVYSNNPLVQTSWDYSIRFSSKNQELLWESNVKTLLQNSIDVQVAICITKLLIENITPAQLFNYFSNFGIKYINFERLTLNGNTALNSQLMPSNKSLNAWLLDAYKISKQNNILIQLFESIEKSINGELIGCRARKCTQNVITINPDGSIASCPNTAHMPFDSITCDLEEKRNAQQKHVLWIKKEEIRNQKCYTCKYYKYCNGDCFQLSWDETGCPGLKSIYEYIINECGK